MKSRNTLTLVAVLLLAACRTFDVGIERPPTSEASAMVMKVITPTATIRPTNTPEATATATPVIPTLTPTPASTPPSTPLPVPSDTPTSQPPVVDIAQAEQLWAAQNITHYRIEVRVNNSHWFTQLNQITVKDKAVVDSSASCLTGSPCEVRAYTPEEYTVPGLFARARSASEGSNAQWVKIVYDPIYGYPKMITGNNPEIADDEVSWDVTTFEILSP